MTLEEALTSVWRQILIEEVDCVELRGEQFDVETTHARKLRAVQFIYGTHRIEGIEQNPQTTSRWAELARQGNRVMQFKCTGRYIGNICEGKLLRYPAWRALKLPE